MARARALLEAYNCGHDTITTDQQYTISDSHTSATGFPHLSQSSNDFLEQIETIQDSARVVDGKPTIRLKEGRELSIIREESWTNSLLSASDGEREKSMSMR